MICAADALDVISVEARRGQGKPQQAKCFVAVFLEHPQRAAEPVAFDAEAQLDGAAVKPFTEGLGVEIGGAFVEQAGDHVADARLVGRVLSRAARERIFHRHQRNGGVLNEPGLDTSRRHQMLDFRRCERRDRGQGGQCETYGGEAGGAPRRSG